MQSINQPSSSLLLTLSLPFSPFLSFSFSFPSNQRPILPTFFVSSTAAATPLFISENFVPIVLRRSSTSLLRGVASPPPPAASTRPYPSRDTSALARDTMNPSTASRRLGGLRIGRLRDERIEDWEIEDWEIED